MRRRSDRSGGTATTNKDFDAVEGEIARIDPDDGLVFG